jgi:hypothetical protein
VAYTREKQEMVMDAHIKAIAFFGGVCRRGIYDNLKTVVIKGLPGKECGVSLGCSRYRTTQRRTVLASTGKARGGSPIAPAIGHNAADHAGSTFPRKSGILMDVYGALLLMKAKSANSASIRKSPWTTY